MRKQLASFGVSAAERGLPDGWTRAGMRRVIAARLATEHGRTAAERAAMLQRWHDGPVALVPEVANEQHYEVPAEFFELILGPRLKYSSCLWEDGASTLGQAEDAMLRLTERRAGIVDGMRILDLGCGWGSLSLWLAERFPAASIVAVSNSASQGRFIAARASAGGLANVRHRVADVNDLELEGTFDAVVSVEMMEHVRNHPALLERVAAHLEPDARVFVHVFAHRSHYWEFVDEGPGDWMARTFFAGGVMPSHTDFDRMIAPFDVEASWWVDGRNYRRTLDAWLARLDAQRPQVADVLAPVYGDATERWVQRWRMFLMACSEFFGWDGGRQLGVSHHRLRLT
jgi:cyclopropane-fatty-acyl-phospholipid synthase